ncbi:MAG: hypothetical protein JWP15_3465 [Alphaproteobacteria bacterium]|nr:hypothetical protein [Alphaproteobacteria bacterium]
MPRDTGRKVRDAGSGAAYALDHLAGAAAHGTFPVAMMAGAVAMRADILPGSRSAWRRFVARIGRFVAHAGSTQWKPAGSLLIAALLLASPARADELFGGVYAHDVNWVTRSGIEPGADFELGWRGRKLGWLGAIGGPRPHALVSVNSAGATSFAAAGLSWKIGGPLYVRPGVGIAIHTGPDHAPPAGDRIWLGSRILFEPELGIGARLGARVSLEASWVHLSHAQLFGRQNPGLDTVGLRLNYRFR